VILVSAEYGVPTVASDLDTLLTGYVDHSPVLPTAENTYPTSLFCTKFVHQYDDSLLFLG
jgi:hypothetical protein